MKNILDTIGNTPLVRLNSFDLPQGVRLFAKLEGQNPGGSVKDRVALSMVLAGEMSGALTREKIILEATSGNTGIGLALVAAVKGYRCHIVMSEAVSPERRTILEALGAEVFLTPAAEGTDGAIAAAAELARRHPHRYFVADQFNNPANWQAHYKGTAPEILRDTRGAVTHIVAALGTGGTLTGIARFFHDRQLPVRMVAAEPLAGHRIQGMKNMTESAVPGIYDPHLPDEHHYVPDRKAFALSRHLAKYEGVFAGMSAGAALYAALQTAATIRQGTLVVIIPDRGEKYLSTPLYRKERLQQEKKVQEKKVPAGSLRQTGSPT